MKKKILLVTIWILVIGFSHAMQNITIDVNVQYQTIYGFGASDAWNFDFAGKY